VDAYFSPDPHCMRWISSTAPLNHAALRNSRAQKDETVGAPAGGRGPWGELSLFARVLARLHPIGP
jgi:hypothetical protein